MRTSIPHACGTFHGARRQAHAEHDGSALVVLVSSHRSALGRVLANRLHTIKAVLVATLG